LAFYTQELNDFMDFILTDNPVLRPSAQEALEHPWFDNIREGI
jgi:hypothetical protein